MHDPNLDPPEGRADADATIAVSDTDDAARPPYGDGDRFVIAVSHLFAWLFPVLMCAICAQVFLRGLGANQAWLDDLQWWLYGAVVLVGIAYAVTTDSHVRVDIFYDGFAETKRRRIDIFALAWLFLPFLILAWDTTLPYALRSIIADEGSDSPNGLHNLWLLKSFVNIVFVFTAIATWCAYVRALSTIMRPSWWCRLAFAFPALAYACNLAIHYAALGLIKLATEAATAREASRHPFLGELELGAWAVSWATLAGLMLASLLVMMAYGLRDRTQEL